MRITSTNEMSRFDRMCEIFYCDWHGYMKSVFTKIEISRSKTGGKNTDDYGKNTEYLP